MTHGIIGTALRSH